MKQELRAAAHDLSNLVARLTFLAETLDRQLASAPAKAETAELLADTMKRLSGIADRLRGMSAGEGGQDA